MKRIFHFTLVLVFMLLSALVMAQETPDSAQDKRFNFMEFTYQAGKVLPSNDFVKGENASGEPIDYYQSFRGEFGWQTKGTRLWEQLYSLPYFGIGYYQANFFNSQELGMPSALYGFYGGSIKKYSKWSIDYRIGFGLTYNWKPYDPDLNPYNYAIGSYNTVYIDAGVVANIPITQQFDLGIGMSFTHFSNGATSLPNLGINLMASKFSLRYNFYEERPQVKAWDIPEYKKDHEFYFSASLGSKQVTYDTTNTNLDSKYYDINYAMATVSFAYQRQIGHKVKFGGGLDINYDGTVDAQIDIIDGEIDQVIHPLSDKLGIGIVGTFEWVIARMSIIAQPGYHILRKEIEGQTPPMYQRLGVKYHFLPNTFAGIYIKAYNFSVADYIEWTVGHRIKWY